MSTSVEIYLNDLKLKSDDTFEIVNEVRYLFKTLCTEVEEQIKYGGILFSVNGTDIGGIFSYKSHTSIEFSEGFKLKDPNMYLEGSGKFRRHLKLKLKSEILSKDVKAYILQTIQNV